MDKQEVTKSKCEVYRRDLYVLVGDHLILVMLIVFSVKHFSILLHLKDCIRLNCDLILCPFSCSTNLRIFLTSCPTFRVFEIYITKLTFYAYVQDFILALHTCALGRKALMLSWNFLLKILASSGDPLNVNRVPTLQGLDWGVLSSYHLLNMDM